MFPMINSREEALNAIASMRYPKAAGEQTLARGGVERRATPSGIGGLLCGEYLAKADVWPLDPEGELLAVIQIETQEAIDQLERS